MPWLETSPKKRCRRYFADLRAGLYTNTKLSECYGMRRKTGHKWRERAEEGSRAALADHILAPRHSPLGPNAGAELLYAARRAHP